MSDWNSEQYLKFKTERTQPSIDLVNRINVENPKRIIDIGCGPGNSTAQLKKKYPNAYVLGVDFSPNMIEKAKSDYKDIEFMIFDATKDFNKLKDKYDIVFSNACIQWVPDHKRLIENMMSILNPNGVLAVQMPAQYEMPMNEIVQIVSHSEKWCNKISENREFYYLTEEEYFELLSELSTDFSMWKTIYHHNLPSQESIVEWYKSTGLKPYLEQLSNNDRIEFENDILSEVKKSYPLEKYGVIFRFHRLFFTAKNNL